MNPGSAHARLERNRRGAAVEAAGRTGRPDGRGLSRRSLLGLSAVAAAALAGCSGDGDDGGSGPSRSPSGSAPSGGSSADGPVTWANWPDYIDVDDDRPEVCFKLAAFTEKSGIEVTYKEVINDNEQFVATIR